MTLLEDRVAVVTGGSSGIGRGISLAYAEQGADVLVADVREDPKGGGRPTHEKIAEDTDAEAAFVECDVTNVDDLEAAVEAADEFGGVSVMVNNAGIWHDEDFLETTVEEYQQMMDINLKGVFFGCQAAARRMVDTGAGCIVNVSSVDGLFGNGARPTYAASKAGVTLLTYSLAHRFGDQGIRVNAIHPGGVRTMIGSEFMDPDVDPEAAASGAQEFLEKVPLGRYGQPEEIAGAAVYLASDLASYVTGESLVVDGGWTSWR